MKQLLSPSLVKRSLSSHSWVGLLVGAFMYLICLSGTVAVLYPDFERWEQPAAPEFVDLDPAALDRAYAAMRATGTPLTHHLYLTLPTRDMPRTVISTEDKGWFVNADGSLGEAVAHDWTHLLTELHNYLHLPASVGMIVVSLMGTLLCSLIVSGFLSHPGIFKEAFSFRRQGSARLEQVDLHNRLSVWGAPFHLMIAVTGAFFGLAGLLALLANMAFSTPDEPFDALALVYGAEPALRQEAAPPALGRAYSTMQRVDPDHEPFFLTVENADEPERQYMVIGTRHRDRLIWGEQHRLDAQGNYLDKIGFSDGEAGRQAVFSVYRLHFGHFSGWGAKLLYLAFGLASTVVAATGINIWLSKRKARDWLNNLWVGLVWGAPLALVLTALSTVVLGAGGGKALFWLVLVAAMALAQRLDDEARLKAGLQLGTGVLLVMLVVGHALRFGAAAFGPAALIVNCAILGAAALFLHMGRWRYRRLALRGDEARIGAPAR